jgi:hypothetical protein
MIVSRKQILRLSSSAVHAAVTLFSIVMLLAFPANSPHSFHEKVRAPEIRHTIIRHTAVGQTAQDVSLDPVATTESQPLTFVLSKAQGALARRATRHGGAIRPRISLTRLLLRLKLMTSGLSDPLI